MQEALSNWGAEILLGILIPMLGALLNKWINAFKGWADAQADALERKWNLEIEETARQRVFGALDTAAELVIGALTSVKDIDTADGQNALREGLDHVKESMSDSIEVLAATDDALLNVLKKNVLLKANEAFEKVGTRVEGMFARD